MEKENIMQKIAKKFKGERTFATIVIIIFMLGFWVSAYAPFKAVFVSMIALIAFFGTYEMIKSVKCESKILMAVSMIFSAAEVFLICYHVKINQVFLIACYVLFLLCLMVPLHAKIKYTDVSMALVASVLYTYSLSCFCLIREYYTLNDHYTRFDCYWLFLSLFGASWLTDVGAFLVGRKIGKHKLCPKISPKKSVEGAVAGVVINAIIATAVFELYRFIIYKIYDVRVFGGSYKSTLILCGIMVVLSIISMFGDLSASVHKRNCGIKDYSNILPGHGGILDRFDSSIFVLPAMYMIIHYVNI